MCWWSSSLDVASRRLRLMAMDEPLQDGTVYNPLATTEIQNPYPTLARLRAQSPIHFSRVTNSWVLSRYRDVDEVLRDHRRFSSDPATRLPSGQSLADAKPNADSYTMLIHDPPDHTRLRALVNKAFTQRSVDRIETRIRHVIDDLLDEIPSPSAFDLMTALAKPLPVLVIAELLGFPATDRSMLCEWSREKINLLEPTADTAIQSRQSARLDAYVRSVVELRRSEPGDDVLSALLIAEQSGDALTIREIENMVRLLLITGNETTASLIGNGVLALLRNPQELQRIREDRDLIPAAIEELLRFEPPIQAGFRGVTEDCDFHGTPFRRGDGVILLLGAANRDPSVFSDPDRLDVTRRERSQISFGRGIHHCIGAPLARLEGRLALEALLQRFSSMHLREENPQFYPGIILRELQSLPISATLGST